MIDEDASVLDASALLAYLNAEPGAQAIEEALSRPAFIGAANWAEVLTKLVDQTGDPVETILDRLREQKIIDGLLTVLPFTADEAVASARLRPATRPFGLSLGDRAAVALAQRLELPVLTADRTWQEIEAGIPVRVIR
jgi:PIN domain nuclease of toxin-antitoxin system